MQYIVIHYNSWLLNPTCLDVIWLGLIYSYALLPMASHSMLPKDLISLQKSNNLAGIN